MATIVDDYTIVGASGDNFDCDDTGGWTKGGNADDATTEDNRVEGDKALGLTTSDKDESWWYHDISSSNRFKITEKDLGLWFYYIKGKGDNILVQDSTAVVVRLYFGGTDKYADYRLTEAGDLSLAFGWQMLMCSGKELNGGSTGGGHNDDSDWDLDIYRFEFRINCANKAENPLGLDAIFVGTELEVQSGDSDTPVTMQDLEQYTFTDRSFPIGTVKIDGKLANIHSGLKITSGGYVAAENQYLLFNQSSAEVKHHITVDDGTLRVGKNVGKAYNGCQIVKPSGRTANVVVNSNGTLLVYNSKLYRWDTITLNGTSDIQQVDIDSCELLVVQSDNNELNSIAVHDAVNNTVTHSMEIQTTADSVSKLLVYRCKDGVKFTDSGTVSGARMLDNTDYDILVLDGKDPSVVDSVYSNIKRV